MLACGSWRIRVFLLLCRSCCPRMSGPSWCAGRGRRGAGGLTGPGSSWHARRGCPMPQAARALGVAVRSVSKWRRQFADQRLAGLEDAAPVGHPKAELVLAEAERAQLIRWARRAKHRPVPGAAGEDRAGAARRAGRTSRSPPIWGSMSRPWAAGGPGSSPGGWVACMMSRGRAGRRRSCWIRSKRSITATLEEHPGRRHALVAVLDGGPQRAVASPTIGRIWRKFDLKPHLTGHVQAVHRPALRGEGRRRRRPVPQPAREGRGAVRG